VHDQVVIGEHAETGQCQIDVSFVPLPYANRWSFVDDGYTASVGLHIPTFIVRVVRCAHTITAQPFKHVHVFDQCGHVKAATVDLCNPFTDTVSIAPHLHIFVHAISMTIERLTVDQQRLTCVFHIAETEL
jgi:hypothetical protein